MSYVNEHVVTNKFKLEGLSDLADLAEKGEYAVSFDLTSRYYRKGEYCQYNYLPFGLKSAPWVFEGGSSKVMRELVRYWRKSGISALPT